MSDFRAMNDPVQPLKMKLFLKVAKFSFAGLHAASLKHCLRPLSHPPSRSGASNPALPGDIVGLKTFKVTRHIFLRHKSKRFAKYGQ